MTGRTILLALLLLTLPARAEDLVSGLSQDLIEITSNYTGTDIVVFGAIEKPAAPEGRDIVVVVRGPDIDITARRRDRVAGIWVNRDAAQFIGMPAYYYLASTRPLAQISSAAGLARYGIGVNAIAPNSTYSHHNVAPFLKAAIRLMTAQHLYAEAPGGIDFLSETLFRTKVPVPAGVARGQYNVEVYLLRDGDVVSAQSTPLFVDQTGVERRLFNFAHNNPLGYGLAAVLMALFLGWISSALFRRPA